MTRHSRFPGLTVAAGLPPTLMILTGHPMLGGATLGVVLLAWVAHARMEVRARQAQQARLLDYAQTAVHLGGDPSPVISALRQRPPRDDDEPSWDPAEDELDPEEFDPDRDERPWVHLRASDW